MPLASDFNRTIPQKIGFIGNIHLRQPADREYPPKEQDLQDKIPRTHYSSVTRTT